MIIGWKAIADFLGASEGRVKMAFKRAGIRLPKLGREGRTSPVYLVRNDVLSNALKAAFRELPRGRKPA